MRNTRSVGHAPRAFRAAIFFSLLFVATAARSQERPAPPPPARAELGYSAPYAAYPWRAQGSADAPNAPATRPDAPAATPPRKGSVAFDVGLVTEVPILIGGQLSLEVPHGFLFQGDVGVLPSAYVNAADGVMRGAGAYGSSASELVRRGFQSSLVVRLSAGLRPFEGHGLELLGGYTLLSLGGTLDAIQTIEAATGTTLPAGVPDAQIPVHSTIHAVHASLGWRWLLGEHVVVRASLGYLQAVSSSSRVDLPASLSANPLVAAQLASVNHSVDATLNDAYTKYLKLPVVGLSLGYRF